MKYELSITKDYCANWTVPAAVRELLQNAIDSDAPFECEFVPNGLRIISRGVTLPTSSLLLGATNKAKDDSKIGNFGEGYKIALLVLTRADITTVIYNGNKRWYPGFTYSNTFQSEVLTIEEEEQFDDILDNPCTDLIFEIAGLSYGDLHYIKESCLHFDNPTPLHITMFGNIFDIGTPQASKLYVGGLFICTTELHYGYDIKPQYIKLERDRSTVASFDLHWRVKDLWEITGDYERIGKILEEERPDGVYLEHCIKPNVFTAAYNSFTNSFGRQAIPAASEHERKKLIEAGVEPSTIKVITQNWYNALRKSIGFKEIQAELPKVKTPTELMQEFYTKNKKHMNAYGQINFRKLIKISESWGRK